MTVCTDCHTSAAHKPGGILYNWMKEHKKTKQYKEPVFMNVLRLRTFEKYPEAEIIYGSETSPRRKGLGLEKTHYNDAIAIAGVVSVKENPCEWFRIKQFRKKKRSLHEAIPRKGKKIPNVTQKRNAKNTRKFRRWYLNDEVTYSGIHGWISGFANASAYVQNINGRYIQAPGKTHKAIPLSRLKNVCHNNTWQYSVHKKGE